MPKRLTGDEKFWVFAERNHEEVSKWPQWMKGGKPMRELDAAKPARKGKR